MEEPDVSPFPPAKSGRLLRVWLTLSIQSFGGGSTTLALIERAAVEQEKWVTEAEFNRYWAICQIAPGINLLCITILLGRRVKGAWGAALAVVGLLLPSVSVTVLMTACYVRFQDSPALKSALRGVLPASVGLGFLTSWKMFVQWLKQGKREGKSSLLLMTILLLGGMLAMAQGWGTVLLILLVSGVVGALGCHFLALWGVKFQEEKP
jgi:chromate transporter